MIAPDSYLTRETSLGDIFRARSETLKHMTAVLAEHAGDLSCNRDVVRFLLTKGFSTIEVAILAGQARMLAYQVIVAREMSEPC